MTSEILLAKDVAWDRQNPCSDCPFIKSSPFHEGVAANLSRYVQSIENGTFAHTCHKTDNRQDCDGPRDWEGKPRHCTGAILMLLKTRAMMDLQLPLLEAAERGEIDLRAMTEKAHSSMNVFRVPELLRFYADELAKRLSTPAAKAELRRSRRRARKNVRRSFK